MTYAELAEQMRLRQEWCKQVSQRLYAAGWAVTPEFVNRHYRKFQRWDTHVWTTGNLVKATGIKRRPNHQ